MTNPTRPATAWNLLDSYRRSLQIPFRAPEPDAPMWDGNALQECGASSLAHEIAHWLLAEPGRRSLVNYGLGGDYQWLNSSGVGRIVAPGDAVVEEQAASALGICFEELLGMDWWATFRDHDWSGELAEESRSADGYEPCVEHGTFRQLSCLTCVGSTFDLTRVAVTERLEHFETWLGRLGSESVT